MLLADDSHRMTILGLRQDMLLYKSRWYNRDQARGRLGRNGRPGGRNFALNGTQGEVGVSLKKKKKKKFFFFFFFF